MRVGFERVGRRGLALLAATGAVGLALVAGVAARTGAAVAAVLMLEIVISLMVTGGLSDLTLRDVGVPGLAGCLTGASQQRLVLAG